MSDIIIPKTKYCRYNTYKGFEYYNNMDDDIIDEYSEFMIGSITKIFTMIQIIIFHMNNKLSIYDRVTKYFTSEHDDFSDITILDLLNHTSGISPSVKYIKHKYKNASDSSKEILNQKVLIKPRGKLRYTSIDYILLGKIIEDISGKSYLQTFKKYIFDPLDMKNTWCSTPNIILYGKDGNQLSNEKRLSKYFLSTGGGLYSCLHDLIIFSNHITNLLKNDMTMLNDIYMVTKNKFYTYIQHNGDVNGGYGSFSIRYDKNWNIDETNIFLSTIN